MFHKRNATKVQLPTLPTYSVHCMLTFLKGFHFNTFLTYWVNCVQIKVIFTAVFVFEQSIRLVQKQSSHLLSVPKVLILHWASYEEQDFRFRYQMVYTLSETMTYDERTCPFNELLLINHDKRIFPSILLSFYCKR